MYDPPQKDDGFRVLVDRLWPRGVTKDRAKVDLWLREIAPSDSLRKWFSHDPSKWERFQSKFNSELEEKADLVKQIKALEKDEGVVTLLYSTKETRYNNAVALCNFLKRQRP